MLTLINFASYLIEAYKKVTIQQVDILILTHLQSINSYQALWSEYIFPLFLLDCLAHSQGTAGFTHVESNFEF